MTGAITIAIGAIYRVIEVFGFELFFASHFQYKITCVGLLAIASFHIPSHEMNPSCSFFVHCHIAFGSLRDTNLIFDEILSNQLFSTIYGPNRLQLNQTRMPLFQHHNYSIF